MPKLIIDNQEVTVAEGTNLLEAARQLDIEIPHFCYHEALGSVGSCRLCAVKVEQGPITGVQMACMLKAQDGMVISSVDAEAVELRQHVIEWAMTNHPHDCPVCDEGGECQLQQMTVAGGHGVRRYSGPKCTFTNQDFGPFVQQEMNRCITCYRCVRTYRDYCGGEDYGVFGSRNRVFFGRLESGPLQSPFAGNIIDVCPTGVLTNKPFRYKSRVWDLQEAPSICPHCSLGCATVPGGRYRELQRVRAGQNEATNGFFICDRGRFGYDHVNHPQRPREPRVDGQPLEMSAAIAAARRRVEDTVREHGPEAVAFLGSSRASFEANALLQAWAAQVGSSHQAYEVHSGRDRAARVLAARLGERARSMQDVRTSDFVLLCGVDPLAEGPMLVLAIRQAVRAGAKVIVLDPRAVELPCAATRLALAPEQLTAALHSLSGGVDATFSRQQQVSLEAITQQLQQAERPILIGGADLLGEAGINALCDSAEALSTPQRSLGVMALLAGPNSFGGAMLAGAAEDFDATLDAIQQGAVRTLVCLSGDPFRGATDPARAQAALGHLEQLITIDSTPSLAAQRADIFLPSRATAEMAGSFVNNEGRVQAYLPVLDPGLPLSVAGEGEHPPREFFQQTPGSAPEADWWILAELLSRDSELEAIRAQLAQTDKRLTALTQLDNQADGLRLDGAGCLPPSSPQQPLSGGAGDGLKLLVVSANLGSSWLAHLSGPLAEIEPQPYVCLHPQQAQSLNLEDGERAVLTTHLGHCPVSVKIDQRVAPGQAQAPQLFGAALEALTPGSLLDCRLETARDKEGSV
ncbi:MAG: NADH-quinone oxidoreductase subunit NuoG [Desulfuromonadales bacterium]|nr:NADH-quinone oxidoreductase subunit NuoG [Desulfuromonadales bacterium]